MKTIIEVIKIDFDNMENNCSDATVIRTMGMFEEGNGLRAHGKVKKWFKEQEPIGLYLGHDGEVYPQFRLKKHFLK